ncbi:phage baseplate assembly protein V [Leptospirillum ferriphilum]|uniref:phage baseplate assembly protein V n=1 Tax=Leptospirillum ferriphilum TaxID=178606 RepID=UPI00117ABD1E|nr:phage baseplate assembly protein V [Leptospirillum ferriphilum]
MSMDLVSHLDVMRREAERILAGKTFPRFGVIKNYDPNTYRAKVQVEPEGILTGWLPISSEYVGNGFGIFVGPAPGDTVVCQFIDGDFGMGVIGSGKIFLPTMPPVPCPSGQVMLIHQSGTYFKLLTAGDLDGYVAGNLNLTVEGNASITSPNPVSITAPTVQVDGNVAVSGSLTGSGSGGATMNGPIESSAGISGATLSAGNGATGSFTAASGQTITVENGIITGIS